jgi:hypothetical protein
VNGNLRLGRHQLQQATRELVQIRLGEVTVERLAVGPLFDRDEAQRVLDGGEEAVAQAPLLTPP